MPPPTARTRSPSAPRTCQLLEDFADLPVFTVTSSKCCLVIVNRKHTFTSPRRMQLSQIEKPGRAGLLAPVKVSYSEARSAACREVHDARRARPSLRILSFRSGYNSLSVQPPGPFNLVHRIRAGLACNGTGHLNRLRMRYVRLVAMLSPS